MYLEWKLNDEVIGLSLEDFEKDYESFFGYMMIKLGDFTLGYSEKRFTDDEGDVDISYYIDNLIECGITILLGQKFSMRLLDNNLLGLNVNFDYRVHISVVHVETGEVDYSFEIKFEDLKNEIDKNLKKYIKEVNDKNRALLNSKTVKRTILLYDIFIKLFENQKDILPI